MAYEAGAYSEPVSEILEFWFGAGLDELQVQATKGPIWFGSSPELDQTIRDRFGSQVEAAAEGRLDAWLEFPYGRLAAIILLDQFTRNIYRGTAQAFKDDPKALSWCRAGVELGQHKAVRSVERPFFLMPLMHAESLQAQDQAITLFEELVSDASAELRGAFEHNLKFSHMHRDLIVKFGRYPHRNEILGRESTAEERAHLAASNQSFGQAKR